MDHSRSPTPASRSETTEAEKGQGCWRGNDVDEHGHGRRVDTLNRGEREGVRTLDVHVEGRDEPGRKNVVLRILDVEERILRVTSWERRAAGDIVVVGNLHIEERRRDGVAGGTGDGHRQTVEILNTARVVDVVVEVRVETSGIRYGGTILTRDLRTGRYRVGIAGERHIQGRLTEDRALIELKGTATERVVREADEVAGGLTRTDMPRGQVDPGRLRRGRRNRHESQTTHRDQTENRTIDAIEHVSLR